MRSITDIRRSAHRLVRAAAHSSYSTAKLYNQWLLEQDARKSKETPVVLVYQMAKVGSTSVLSSLEKMAPHLTVLHVHMLNRTKLPEIESIYASNWHKGHNPKHLWHSLHVIRHLEQWLEAGRIRIVTLVRDPIARNISAFFEILHLVIDYDYRAQLQNKSPEEIAKELLPLFYDRFDQHNRAELWFDQELRANFGIDVYATPFRYEKGYQIYRNAGVEALLIRLEDLNCCAKEAFQSFLGIEDFRLGKSNTSAKKPYHAIYEQFVKRVSLAPEYIDQLYGARFMRHFYSAEEIARLRQRWLREDRVECSGV